MNEKNRLDYGAIEDIAKIVLAISFVPGAVVAYWGGGLSALLVYSLFALVVAVLARWGWKRLSLGDVAKIAFGIPFIAVAVIIYWGEGLSAFWMYSLLVLVGALLVRRSWKQSSN